MQHDEGNDDTRHESPSKRIKGQQKKHVVNKAVPGNGKTQWLARMITQMLQDGHPASSIVAFAFTNQAAGELGDRIFLLSGERVDVCTIHSWCNRFNQYATPPNETHTLCVAMMVPLVLHRVDETSAEDFQTMLHDYQHKAIVIVDEAQDISWAQLAVIKAICKAWGAKMIFCGDPQQSIYGFNDAEPELFDKLHMDEQLVADGGCAVVISSENWRSSPAIVAAANSGLGMMSQAPMVAMRHGPGDDKLPRPLLRCYREVHDEVADVCQHIAALVKDGVPPRNIAVLNRYNAGLMPFFQQLARVHEIDCKLSTHPDIGDQARMVQMRTFHSAKGGGWTHVFVTGAVDEAWSPEQEAEERRCFHVAITRAKDYLYVSYYVLKGTENGEHAKMLTRFIDPDDIDALYDFRQCNRDGDVGRWVAEEVGEPKACPRKTHTRLDEALGAALTRMSTEDRGYHAVYDVTSQTGRMHVADCLVPIATVGVTTPTVFDTHDIASFFWRCAKQFAMVLLRRMAAHAHCALFDETASERLLLPYVDKRTAGMLKTWVSSAGLAWDVTQWPEDIDGDTPIEDMRRVSRMKARACDIQRRVVGKPQHDELSDTDADVCKRVLDAAGLLHGRYFRNYVRGWDSVSIPGRDTSAPFRMAAARSIQDSTDALKKVVTAEGAISYDKDALTALMGDVMQACLPADTIAFTKTCCILPTAEIVKSVACTDVCTTLLQIVEWVSQNLLQVSVAAVPTSRLPQPPRAVKFEERDYASAIDASYNGVHVVLSAGDHDDQGTMSAHTILAAILSTPPAEASSRYAIVNLKNGGVSQFVASKAQRDRVAAAVMS